MTNTGHAAARWGLPILGFGTFAIGTTEFVLAGVLPQLGSSLNVSVTTAGQVVTVFALTCAVLSPVLATATAAWSRRGVLLLALLVYLVGNTITAVAPSFAVVLLGQIVAAAGAGLFIPAASVTASALVSAERRGRAIAAVTTGLTAATALGAPIGTVVGSFLGWRATMWFVSVLAVIALAAIVLAVPNVAVSAPAGLKQRLAPLRDRRIVVVLATTLVAFTSAYIVYTYIAVVFEPATGGDGTRLAVLMFVFGLVGTVGNFGAGALADRLGSRVVVGGAVVLLGISLLVMPLVTGSYVLSLLVMVVYGIAAWAITTPQQHRLITLAPADAPLLISLNAAFLYLAISLSGVIGAVGIGTVGANALPIIAAGIALLALVLSEFGHRLATNKPAQSTVAPLSPKP
ncbi:MFS transporter [Actinosynnema sp. CA-299493]